MCQTQDSFCCFHFSNSFRCKVPECDLHGANNRALLYDQQWLPHAIPHTNGKYDNCYRYAPTHSTNTTGLGQCSTDMFNTSKKIACTEFVYASDERNIQTEVNCLIVYLVSNNNNNSSGDSKKVNCLKHKSRLSNVTNSCFNLKC